MRPRSPGRTAAAAIRSPPRGIGATVALPKPRSPCRADQPDGFDSEPPRVQHREIIGMDILEHQQARAAVRQDVLKLRPPRGDVDRHRHRAKPGAAEHDFEELDPVGADDRDSVAGLDARAAQRGGEAGRGVAGVGVAPCRVAGADQRLCSHIVPPGGSASPAASARRARTMWTIALATPMPVSMPMPLVSSPCRRDSWRSREGRE